MAVDWIEFGREHFALDFDGSVGLNNCSGRDSFSG